MKKSILTFGLLGLVMMMTSFSSVDKIETFADTDTGGTNQGVIAPGPGKKLDADTGGTNQGVVVAGPGKKLDIDTGGSNQGVIAPGSGKKLD